MDQAATDRLLPIGVDLRRGEVELFDPTGYRTREVPPFVSNFLLDGAPTVAADVTPYLERFLPQYTTLRDRPVLHVHMVNRCGSTLLLNALARHPGLACFNELDPWVIDHHAQVSDDAATQLNTAIGTHLRRWAATAGVTPVLKHRAEALLVAPDLQRAFPRARALFIFRHPDAVIASHLAKPPSSTPGGHLTELARTCGALFRWDPALGARVYAAFYLETVARYRALAESPDGGAAWRCLRYETFVAAPRRALAAVATFFELGVEPAQLDAMCREVEFDAKARAAGRTAPFRGRDVAPFELDAEPRAALARAWSAEMPGELL